MLRVQYIFACTFCGHPLRNLPNVKTGHNWDWNVEGHHTAQDWHELVCFNKLDKTHILQKAPHFFPKKWNANRFCVQIRFPLNVGPGIDGGDPDDGGESPGGEDHQGGDLRRPPSSVRKRTSDGEVPWKMILREIDLVILDL